MTKNELDHLANGPPLVEIRIRWDPEAAKLLQEELKAEADNNEGSK